MQSLLRKEIFYYQNFPRIIFSQLFFQDPINRFLLFGWVNALSASFELSDGFPCKSMPEIGWIRRIGGKKSPTLYLCCRCQEVTWKRFLAFLGVLTVVSGLWSAMAHHTTVTGTNGSTHLQANLLGATTYIGLHSLRTGKTVSSQLSSKNLQKKITCRFQKNLVTYMYKEIYAFRREVTGLLKLRRMPKRKL